MGFLTGKRLSSPFSKAARHELAECGDRGLPAIVLACPLVPRSGRRAQARRAGGFCYAPVLPKTTAAYSVYKQS
ncbi:MAG: hypothetical protein PVH08_13110 [Syntrophobacterales bacterium]